MQPAEDAGGGAGAGAVLAALIDWRVRAGRAARLSPKSIIDDDTLRILAAEQPATLDEVVRLAALGPSAARHLGPRLLDTIATAVAERL